MSRDLDNRVGVAVGRERESGLVQSSGGRDGEKELQGARQAAREAARRGFSLLDVLEWYAREGRRIRTAPLVGDCVQEFLRSKVEAGRSVASIDGYKSLLLKLARQFGEKAPADLTTRDVFDFLRAWRDPNTRNGYYWRLNAFFEWLILKRYALSNPLLAGSRPRGNGGRGSFFTPAEAREILRQARDTDQLGFWVLSLFAGMRTSEICRLQGMAMPWSLVRIGDRVIEVPARNSKTRRHTIRITPVLRAWLRILKIEGVPFFPPANPGQKIRELRLRVLKQTRGPGPLVGIFNMGRRSWISYRLALPGASYSGVAASAGSSERMIRKYYRRRVTRRTARAYFHLTPDRIGPR